MARSVPVTVGSFPYAPGFNPYQRLFTTSIEDAGLNVVRIGPEKWFPLQKTNRVACDVLHIDWPHDWYSGRNFVTRILKTAMYLHGLKALKHRLVWTAHNLVAHDCPDSKREHAMIQALVNRCNGILVFSNAARNQIEEAYSIPDSTEIRMIHHGHYVDCYPNEYSMSRARHQLNVPEADRLVVSVGSIKPYKGYESLIETFAATGAQSIRWIIAGRANNADFGDKIRQLISKANQDGCQIEFHDRVVPDDQLQVYFNAANACVLPFERVLNSGSLLLAMSFGCPVVAPSIGSIPEVIDPKWGFLYEPTTTESLSQVVQNALDCVTKTERRKIKQEMISFVRESYAWERIGNELRTWYEDLVQTDSTTTQ